MSTPTTDVPNHHADYPGFSGMGGLLAGLTMLIGRGAVARLAADLTAVAGQDRVVDVGCGPGAAAREAARRGAAVIGLDPAPVMLTLARRLTRRDASITWTEGAAEAMPLPDGSATVVWSIATVHHWRDLDAGLSEVRRVLAPGGRLLAIERRTRPGARGLASTDGPMGRRTPSPIAAGPRGSRMSASRRTRRPGTHCSSCTPPNHDGRCKRDPRRHRWSVPDRRPKRCR
jgi:SAM-dependent methyltransferase